MREYTFVLAKMSPDSDTPEDEIYVPLSDVLALVEAAKRVDKRIDEYKAAGIWHSVESDELKAALSGSGRWLKHHTRFISRC